MKQRSVLEFHILSGEASREVLPRGGDSRRVMGSQPWARAPRRRGSQCSRNILNLLELGSSGLDRLRESFGHYLLGSGWHPACGLFEPGQSADYDRYTQLLRKLKSDIWDKRMDTDIKHIWCHHNSRIHTSLGRG